MRKQPAHRVRETRGGRGDVGAMLREHRGEKLGGLIFRGGGVRLVAVDATGLDGLLRVLDVVPTVVAIEVENNVTD